MLRFVKNLKSDLRTDQNSSDTHNNLDRWQFDIESFNDAVARRSDHCRVLKNGGHESESSLVRKLSACRKARRCGSGACPVCLRLYRRRLLQEAEHLFQTHADWTRVSIIPADLDIPGGSLSGIRLDMQVKRLRKRLERSAPCLSKAIVFGGIDFSFNIEENDETQGYWQGHLYLLIAKKNTRVLREAVKAAFLPEETAPRPYRFRAVDNAPAAVTYAFKSMFNRRSRYFVDGEPRTRTLPLKPHQLRELLGHLDDFPIGARLFLRGVRRNGKKLQQITKP
jgi:hypothetical protein